MHQLNNETLSAHPFPIDQTTLKSSAEIEKRIKKKGADRGMQLEYYSYTSTSPRMDLPLFVTVHGISRKCYDQVRLFAPIVEAIGGTVISPLFRKGDFTNYQQLGFTGKGRRADLALNMILNEEKEKWGKKDEPVVLFGYSGGGQFAHRFSMAYPRQIKRLAIAAPGWFTFPDMDIKFPYGACNVEELPDLNFDCSRFLKIPTLVLVGEKDTRRKDGFNKLPEIDKQQGKNRVERATRWVKAMQRASMQYHYTTQFTLSLIPGCGHSFSECMLKGRMYQQIIRFLFADDQLPVSLFQTQPKTVSNLKIKEVSGC